MLIAVDICVCARTCCVDVVGRECKRASVSHLPMWVQDDTDNDTSKDGEDDTKVNEEDASVVCLTSSATDTCARSPVFSLDGKQLLYVHHLSTD